MMKYESPEIEVLENKVSDIVTTSSGVDTGNNELPWN